MRAFLTHLAWFLLGWSIILLCLWFVIQEIKQTESVSYFTPPPESEVMPTFLASGYFWAHKHNGVTVYFDRKRRAP